MGVPAAAGHGRCWPDTPRRFRPVDSHVDGHRIPRCSFRLEPQDLDAGSRRRTSAHSIQVAVIAPAEYCSEAALVACRFMSCAGQSRSFPVPSTHARERPGDGATADRCRGPTAMRLARAVLSHAHRLAAAATPGFPRFLMGLPEQCNAGGFSGFRPICRARDRRDHGRWTSGLRKGNGPRIENSPTLQRSL